MKSKYVIVRNINAGVFAGTLVKVTPTLSGTHVLLRKARRLYYWDGAATLSQLAMEGVKKPGNCKFPQEVDEILLTEATEIIPCTAAAEKSIASVPVWTV